MAQFSGINRMLRMLKLSKLFRILKVVRSLKFIADMAHFNPGMARLVASICCLMLVCHWVACFWYIVAYDTLRSNRTDNDEPLDYPMDMIQGPPGSVDLWRCWRVAFYWSTSLMSGMATFDITPTEDGMVTYVTCSIYISLMFNIIILSTANSAVSSVDSIAQDSKRKLDRVTNYLRFQGINAQLRQQITEYYKHALASSTSKESQALTQELPTQLAARLILDTHKPLIQRCQLFHVVSHVTVLALLQKLQPGTVPPKFIVMREGMPIGALYFIIRGLVQLEANSAIFSTDDDDDDDRVTGLGPMAGTAPALTRRMSFNGRVSEVQSNARRYDKVITDHAFFGDHAMIDAAARAKFTATSLSYVNLVLLTREDFEAVASLHESGGGEGVRQRWKNKLRAAKENKSATSLPTGVASKVGKLKSAMAICRAGTQSRAGAKAQGIGATTPTAVANMSC